MADGRKSNRLIINDIRKLSEKQCEIRYNIKKLRQLKLVLLEELQNVDDDIFTIDQSIDLLENFYQSLWKTQ